MVKERILGVLLNNLYILLVYMDFAKSINYN